MLFMVNQNKTKNAVSPQSNYLESRFLSEMCWHYVECLNSLRFIVKRWHYNVCAL